MILACLTIAGIYNNNFSFVLSFGEFVSFFINEFLSKLLKTLRDHFEIYSVMLVKKISKFLIKKKDNIREK